MRPGPAGQSWLRLWVGCIATSATIAVARTGEAPPAAAGPSAHWRFDAASGNVLPDTSGHGHDATFFSTKQDVPRWTEGIHGRAVVLSREMEEGFEVADSTALNMTGPFTVMAWIKPSRRNAAFEVACMKGDKSGDPPWPGWRLRFFWARAVFEVGTPEGDQPQVRSPEWSVMPGYWNHVAATWDGTNLRLYVNAAEKAVAPFAGTVAPQDPRRPLVLGNYLGRRNAYAFDGALDEIRVYDHCLTPGEILAAATGLDLSP